MGDVHGYDAESSLGFRSFIQFGHDEIQTPATLGVSVSALNVSAEVKEILEVTGFDQFLLGEAQD